MRKTFLILTALCALILWWCWSSKSTVSSTVIDMISSGDVVWAQDTLQVVWPTWFIYSSTNCTTPTQCTEITGEQTWYFKTYTSLDLGITFSVYVYGNALVNNEFYTMVRSGDKVSIMTRGESVQMFEKLPNETLENAIKRVANIENSGDCTIEPAVKLSFDDSMYASGYKAFFIDYPQDKILSWCPADRLCYPSTFCGPYAIGWSVMMFVGNENKTKFYFIDGGQDILQGLWGKAWYQELQFL